VHLREGYPSLFAYCRDALGTAEGEACNRIEVARTARRFPLVLDMLADGRLHLTAARLLAPHLTSDNHHEVLGAARGKISGETLEKMRLAKDTLSHAVPTGDDAAVLDRAFDGAAAATTTTKGGCISGRAAGRANSFRNELT